MNMFLLIGPMLLLLSGCGNRKEQDTVLVSALEGESMIVTSPAFKHEQTIPAKYTCDGQSSSPELVWQQAPPSTKSFALICDDPDALHGTFVHWVLFNIPATVTSLPEGAGNTGNQGVPGSTSFKTNTYGGPCPPSGTHRYFFKLYALDTMLDLPAGTSKEKLLTAMQGHIVAQGELMGTYHRQ